MKYGHVAACLVLTLACAGTLVAQTPTGILQGVVQDASGGVVPDAKIVITNVATNERRELRTDSAGRYVQPFLLPGTYSITAEKTGFRTIVQENVKIDVGQNRSVNLELEIGGVTQEVRVEAAPP